MSKARNLLFTGPFGSSEDIRADMTAFTDVAAQLLDAHAGPTPPSTSEGATLIERSISRVTMLEAFRALDSRQDVQEAEHILRQGTEMIATVSRADTETTIPGTSYALATHWSSNKAGRYLQEAISTDLAQPHSFVPAAAVHVNAVGGALRLIEEAIGELGTSVLETVSGAVLIEDSIIESAFIVPVPQVSVLNTSVFHSMLKTADAVFHEACHQKFYDLLVCRQIARTDFNYLEGPLFGIPWNPVAGKRREMDCLRIVSTIHVYMHLLELVLSVRERRLAEPAETDAMLEEYWQRACFFDTVVRSDVVRGNLGPDAAAMVDWIASIMDRHRSTLDESGVSVQSPYRDDARAQVTAYSTGVTAP